MSATQKTEFVCDLCNRKLAIPGSKLPPGWSHVCIDGFTDREWIDKHVCDKCTQAIVKQVKA